MSSTGSAAHEGARTKARLCSFGDLQLRWRWAVSVDRPKLKLSAYALSRRILFSSPERINAIDFVSCVVVKLQCVYLDFVRVESLIVICTPNTCIKDVSFSRLCVAHRYSKGIRIDVNLGSTNRRCSKFVSLWSEQRFVDDSSNWWFGVYLW